MCGPITYTSTCMPRIGFSSIQNPFGRVNLGQVKSNKAHDVHMFKWICSQFIYQEFSMIFSKQKRHIYLYVYVYKLTQEPKCICSFIPAFLRGITHFIQLKIWLVYVRVCVCVLKSENKTKWWKYQNEKLKIASTSHTHF